MPADLTQLVRSHSALVMRALRRAGVPERDVPDLAQEVFIVAHRRLPEWEGRSKLSTWLYRVALRVASDHRRRACQRRERLPGAEHMPPAAASHELPELERREQTLQLCAALEQLSAEHRQTLVGYELEELSIFELAAREHVPHKTVYSRLYAARRQLRQLLLAQGWAMLGCVMWVPRRTLAALRVFGGSLVHAPLACLLMLVAPGAPRQSAVTAAVSGGRIEPRAQMSAAVTRPSIPLPQPTAARTLKRKRIARKSVVQTSHAPATVTASAPAPALADELKVIHVGGVERPEGELPFGFERIPERPTQRITVRGPRDPVEGLQRELTN